LPFVFRSLIQWVLILPLVLAAILLIGAGHGWLLVVGVAAWICSIALEYCFRNDIAIDSTMYMPYLGERSRRVLTALLIGGINLLIVIFVVLARAGR
jgi:hypothetical protein